MYRSSILGDLTPRDSAVILSMSSFAAHKISGRFRSGASRMGRLGYDCCGLDIVSYNKSLPDESAFERLISISDGLTVVVVSNIPQAHSACTPPKLLNIAPSVTESSYNIVDVVAEVVRLHDIVESFWRDVEA